MATLLRFSSWLHPLRCWFEQTLRRRPSKRQQRIRRYRPAVEALERLEAVRGALDAVPLAHEQLGERRAQDEVILDEENRL